MSSAIFTNNIGTLEMENIMYTINTSFTWSGDSPSRYSYVINLEANVKNTTACDVQNIIANITKRGERGTLVLPNKTYTNMKIMSAYQESDTWTPYGVVNLSFSDDTESGEGIVTIINGSDSITVYEPSLTVNTSKIRLTEKKIHNYNGVIRQERGLDFTRISFTGIVIHNSCSFPESVLNCMEQISSSGLPIIGNLSDFLPNIPSDMDYRKVFVESSNMVWNIDKKSVNITMNFVCPPQET